jgi:hypothetical protein
MLLRNQLVEEKWRPDLIQRNIPLSEGIKPLDLLTDDTARAKWANEGLPIDPLSVENGAIMTNASRWPLMIDPQLQVGMRRGTIANCYAVREQSWVHDHKPLPITFADACMGHVRCLVDVCLLLQAHCCHPDTRIPCTVLICRVSSGSKTARRPTA